MPEQPRRGPDRGFSPENYDELNEEFYEGAPADYFMRRLTLLGLLADRAEELDDLMRTSVSIGRLALRLEGSPNPDSDEAREERQRRDRFVTTEAWTLLHHAAETILRLYLAHSEAEPCQLSR